MSHPPIDTNPSPALVLGKLALAAAAVESNPTDYTDETLDSYRRAALRLAQAAGNELVRRRMP